jgi:mannose-6-phosphate isomerase
MREQRLGPLVLEPIFAERVWGAAELPAQYAQPAPGKRVGEVWLTAAECRVRSGSLAGQTLAELATAHPQAMGAADGAGFPLLIKVLLPHDKLSVQVHPDDAGARQLGEPRGKTECWYVLEAAPGAEMAVGLKDGVDLEQVRAAIADGSMESLMRMLPVKAGDMVFVDAGTVHAIGPGVVVLETQQYSDITYRLFDYGRPRELHVEQGLAATRTETKAGLVAPEEKQGFTRVVSSEYFVVDRFALRAHESCALGEADKLQILFAREAGCTLVAGGERFELPQGFAVVLPAEGREYAIEASGAREVVRILKP